MPINPEIPLQVRPVVPPDLPQIYGNALAMKSHVQQQQLQQQQMQENQMKLEQMRRDRDEDEVVKQSYLRNNGDVGKVAADTAGKVSPKRTHDLNAAHLTLQMDRAKMTNEQNAADAVAADHQAQIIDSVLAAPSEEEKQKAWTSGVALALTKGWVKPGELSEARPPDDSLRMLKAARLGSKAYGAQSQQAASVASSQAQADTHNLTLAGQTVPSDPATYPQWFAAQDPRIQARLKANGLDVYSPEAAASVKQMALSPENQVTAPTRQAQATEAQVKAVQNVKGMLSALPTQAAYSAAYHRYDSQPEMQAQLVKPENWSVNTPAQLRQESLTGDERNRSEERKTAQENTEQWRSDSLDLRRELANQNLAFRQAALANKGGGRQMTPGQRAVEERNINAVEWGTASRPGLHGQRQQIGDQLKVVGEQLQKDPNAKDPKGTPLKEIRAALMSKLTAANMNLQNSQFRKADLYGIGKPDPADVEAAENGAEIQAPDGATWKKQDGVAFFKAMGDGATASSVPAPISSSSVATGSQTPASTPLTTPTNQPPIKAPASQEAPPSQKDASPKPPGSGPGAQPKVQAPAPKTPEPAKGGVWLNVPPELVSKFGGKKVLSFPDDDSARKFAAAAGLTIH